VSDAFADLAPVDERRQSLLEVKLRALVRDHTGHDGAPERFGLGAGLLTDGAAWALVDRDPARGLGAVLAWARRHGDREVHVVVDADTDDGAAAAGTLARRAGAFAHPPAVWRAVERSLEVAPPADPPPDPPLDPRVAPLADVLLAAGLDVVVEHGTLLGEVLGLEVARVADTPDGPVLQIGVGRFDRDANRELFGSTPPADTLAGVVEVVRRYRRPGAPPHPLGRLAPERWLRARVLADPALVGADHLAPVPPPLPRPHLKATSVAPAVGADAQGRAVVAVCSAGIDLDLVPAAADVRLARAPHGARLVLVLARGDDHPVTRAVASMLRDPAEIVTVPDDWRAAG
jgi:hypothetical protein